MKNSLNWSYIKLICIFILLLNAFLTFGQIPDSLVSDYVYVDVTRSDRTDTTSQPTVLVDNLQGFEQDLTQNLSQYGGLLNTQLTATGYFYTKKINGRWWFVDPEGHLMLYIGLSLLKPYITDGFSPFSSSAEWSDSIFPYLKDHGIYSGGGWCGRKEMNFSEQMNYAETRNWLRDFYRSLGNENPGGEKNIPLNPVFHPDWNTFVAQKVLELANEYAGDPRFIGIFSGNELRFDTDILTDCLNLNSSDYNRQYAVQWVKNFRGNSGLVSASNVTSTEMNEFFRHYIESYYKPIYDAIKQYAPNHLCLGSRVYQTALLENKIFVETYAKYVDVMSINRYTYWTEPRSLMDRLAQWADKPWIVTEFYAKGSEFSYLDNIGGAGWTVATQQERGYYYQNQTLTWLQHKSCAGWHWFRYRDEDHTTGKSVSNKGFFNLWHKPYEDVMVQVNQLNRQYLKLAEYFDNETYAGITENTVFADFRVNKTVINMGESVTFTDQSTGSPNSWSWSFAGGTPSVSSSQNPTVTYNTPGTYAVKLISSHAGGSDMITKTGYITVDNNEAKFYVTEDAYVRSGSYSDDNYGSERSLFIKDADPSNNYNRIAFLKFDVSSLTEPIASAKLNFYGSGQTNTGDVLLKKVSDDSWSENSVTFNNKPATVSDLGQKIITQTANWYSIDVTDYVLAEKAMDGVVSMAMLGNENSTITISSKEGNFKPFIEISTADSNGDTFVSENEQPPVFSIYPNPTISKQVTVLIDNTALNSELEIVDINGRTCYKLKLQDQRTQISLDKLNPGVYFINLSIGTKGLCEKLIVG